MAAAGSRGSSPFKYPASANVDLPSFGSDNTSSHHQQSAAYLDPAQYLNSNDNSYAAQHTPALDINDLSALDYNQSMNTNHLSPSFSNHTSPAAETVNFPSYDFNQGNIDNTLINDIDLLQQQQQHQAGISFANDNMSVMNHHSPTPPHLLPGMGRKSSSPSPLASPNAQHQSFTGRPRNASESLDPSSAYDLSQQNGEWAYVSGGPRGHRRMHSDALSDISSHSAHASPYLATLDSFDTAASPLLNAQDPGLGDGLGIAHFSISDASMQQRHYSPAHSPHISPHLMPQQQPLPQFTASDNFGLNGLSNYPQELPQLGNDITQSVEMGQADHMSPPEINIDFVESQRPHNQSLPQLDTGLLPPRAGRVRAKSDTFAGRPVLGSHGVQRGRSPSLHASGALSPYAVASNPSSRDPSPAARGRSASAVSERERVISLADPHRSPSVNGDNKRQQKHPANFECHLCEKRFTRAYNLRSHLRTHTDERPFVCTVCNKAFARQHDRKRHEGLHSGEKKFVCRGPLRSGGQWGCNRRFARADALGRHFRSEAGRICIRPLLDEEASERQEAVWQQQQEQVGYAPQLGEMISFPQALLAQYPALAGFDFSQPQGPIGEEEYGGRSSFDASSGGEMYEDHSENEMSMVMPQQYGMVMPQQHQMNAYAGQPMGSFTNGFEGA